jgi:hypothetical protein
MTGTSLEADLRNCIQNGTALLVVGAGVAAASTSQPVATWWGLLDHGIGRGIELGRISEDHGVDLERQLNGTDVHDWLRVADAVTTALGGRTGGEYERWLRETVGGLKPERTDLLEAITGMRVPLATTNYDDLLEGATGFGSTTWRQPNVFQRVARGDERAVLHLHGFWGDAESVILGTESYDEILADPFAQTALQSFAFLRSFIFVGFGSGLDDPNFRALRAWMRQALARSEYRHYRLVLESERQAALDLHTPEERIVPVVFGLRNDDLQIFLRELGKAPAVVALIAVEAKSRVIDQEQALARSRIAERFIALGLDRSQAEDLAADSSIGAFPGSLGESKVVLVTGDAGIGKSTAADRLYIDQLLLLAAGDNKRVPVLIRARDISPGTIDTVVKRSSQFGDPATYGAVVIIDGAEEPGPSTVLGLIDDALLLVSEWTSSVVIVFSRESPSEDRLGVATLSMPRLTANQVQDLHQRITGREAGVWLWDTSEDLGSDLPAFVILASVFLDDDEARSMTKPAAIERIGGILVDRAIASSAVGRDFFQRLAAAWINSSGQVTVPEVTSTFEERGAISRMSAIGVDALGRINFRVPAIAWWLASEYLMEDLSRLEPIAADARMLHLWSPAIDTVLNSGQVNVIRDLLEKLATEAPAFAASKVRRAFHRKIDGLHESETVGRVQTAMQSWVKGIGPLASAIVPHVSDGKLAQLEVRTSGSGIDMAWRDVPFAIRTHLNWPVAGELWEWSLTLEDLKRRLAAVLNTGLPAPTDVLRHELEYRLAVQLTHAPRVASMARPIDLAEIQAAANGDLPNVHLLNPNNLAVAITMARLLVERLVADGRSQLDPPWPPGDQTENIQWVWDGWSIEALLERGRLVSVAALDAYRALVDRWFPAFTGQLRLSSAWPVRLTSTVERDSRSGWPEVTWKFEPLPLGAEIEVIWQQGRVQTDLFPRDVRETVLRRRPDLEGRYQTSITFGNLALFELDPATGLAYGWLWEDLQEWNWSTGARKQLSSHDWATMARQSLQALLGIMVSQP